MNKKIVLAGLIGLAVCLVVIGIVVRAGKGARGVKSEAGALYQSALSRQSKGEAVKAVKLYQGLIKRFPRDEKAADARYKLGEIYEKEELWQEARDAYSGIIANFPNFSQISDVEKRLWALNARVLFSPIVTEKDIAYKVEPGDTLIKIAAGYNTTADLIMRSNNLKSPLIRPGKRLKVCTAKFSVIVDKSQNYLALKADEEIFKVYPVATGKYNSTPTGTFKIVEKLKNPDWYKEGEGVIAANNPENILGTRWLGLSEPQYGIHGGATTKDLGTQVTNGCIRMLNSDAEELFIILPRGAEVTIVD
ncbi:MAG: L,D-transpeptidase family protein [Candidatus Omnitrophica bacterium]|nr:L,D-transpeptidase family protein [Candidatus Omnitrophota bacterium]MBU3933334.1 L,D-transpeptidase family protein [Candidatus Omnitrophota bacterium]MBU4140605.1 L,D-transpeptidase family protein [Candidatus Omnitrophota bacterium]